MSDIHLHQNDLPSTVNLRGEIALDCEMMGLDTFRDRLCLVQLKSSDSTVHLIQIGKEQNSAPNLKKCLEDQGTLVIAQFGFGDVALLRHQLGIKVQRLFDTKIASRLARTFTDRHGLNDLCKDLLGFELAKDQQTSDWGAATLTDKQKQYAAGDVLHLHAIRNHLRVLLQREGREHLAELAFANILNNVDLYLAGFNPDTLFLHNTPRA